MNFHYLKSLSALALVGMFAANAYAETLSEELVIDFTQKEVGFKLNSYWGGPNDNMQVVETEDGNLLFINGVTVGEDGTPATNDAGYPAWNTMTRYENLALPSGFNFSHIQMIEIEYKPTQDDNVPFSIQLKQTTDPLYFDGEIVVNEWNTLVFDPSGFTTGEGTDIYQGTPSVLDFCMGANGSTNYYIKSIVFYLEKEVTQREKDEAALDKSTAACVVIDFDNWEVSGEDENGEFSSPHIGSNGFQTNRSDMVIDKGPDDYDNNCAHIIYQGWTQIFLADEIIIPEGYTFDDCRLIEYDIYESDIPGVDKNNPDTAVDARNGAPNLKLKSFYNWGCYEPLGNGCSAGNAQLSTVNEWHHIEFRPSAFEWKERDFEENVVDENGDPVLDDNGENVKQPVHWDADQTRDEFGKQTSFAMSIGFFPCCCQTYVDNVKIWFQKSGEDTAVDGVEAVKGNDVIYNIYGQRVDENYRGIVIKNGKKYINK